jgi:hypothetical protein
LRVYLVGWGPLANENHSPVETLAIGTASGQQPGMTSQVPSGLGGKVSVKSESGITWTAFTLAVINAGIGTFLGTAAGFLVGALADAVSSLFTGTLQLHYGLVLAQAATYIGIFVGIVAGIGSGAATGSAVTTPVESRHETAKLPSNRAGLPVAGGASKGEEHSHAA